MEKEKNRGCDTTVESGVLHYSAQRALALECSPRRSSCLRGSHRQMLHISKKKERERSDPVTQAKPSTPALLAHTPKLASTTKAHTELCTHTSTHQGSTKTEKQTRRSRRTESKAAGIALRLPCARVSLGDIHESFTNRVPTPQVHRNRQELRTDAWTWVVEGSYM
eukprot:scaffold1198_cov116-Isochrysis_galbana.AAC.10